MCKLRDSALGMLTWPSLCWLQEEKKKTEPRRWLLKHADTCHWWSLLTTCLLLLVLFHYVAYNISRLYAAAMARNGLTFLWKSKILGYQVMWWLDNPHPLCMHSSGNSDLPPNETSWQLTHQRHGTPADFLALCLWFCVFLGWFKCSMMNKFQEFSCWVKKLALRENYLWGCGKTHMSLCFHPVRKGQSGCPKVIRSQWGLYSSSYPFLHCRLLPFCCCHQNIRISSSPPEVFIIHS